MRFAILAFILAYKGELSKCEVKGKGKGEWSGAKARVRASGARVSEARASEARSRG